MQTKEEWLKEQNCKTFELKTEYGDYKDCIFELDNYSNNGSLYVGITDLEEGPIDDLSINIDASWLIGIDKPNAFYVADYKTSKNTADILVEKGYLKPVKNGVARQNYGTYHLYELTPKALEFVPNSCENKERYEEFFKTGKIPELKLENEDNFLEAQLELEIEKNSIEESYNDVDDDLPF